MLPALCVLFAFAASVYLSLPPREFRAFCRDVRTTPLAALCVAGMAAVFVGLASLLWAPVTPGCCLAACGFGAMYYARKAAG